MLGSEQFFGPIDRKLLRDIHVLTTTIVASTRVAFGVLVGQSGALGLHNCCARVVLRSDEDYIVPLSFRLKLNRPRYIRVAVRQYTHSGILLHFLGTVQWLPALYSDEQH